MAQTSLPTPITILESEGESLTLDLPPLTFRRYTTDSTSDNIVWQYNDSGNTSDVGTGPTYDLPANLDPANLKLFIDTVDTTLPTPIDLRPTPPTVFAYFKADSSSSYMVHGICERN